MFLFYSNQQQKKVIKKKLQKYYPQFRPGSYYYKNFIQTNLKPHHIILDIGCGKGGLIRNFKNVPQLIIGIDKNANLINQNKTVGKKIIGNLNNIPLKNSSIDMAVGEFVLEHLENPKQVFREIYRILKENGKFIFLTPNIKNPIIFLSKILPFSFHQFFRKKILKKEEETHPTFYRINSISKIKTLAKKTGFQKITFAKAGNPEYLGAIKPFVIPSIFIEKIISCKPLNAFQMYLIGCLKKK